MSSHVGHGCLWPVQPIRSSTWNRLAMQFSRLGRSFDPSISKRIHYNASCYLFLPSRFMVCTCTKDCQIPAIRLCNQASGRTWFRQWFAITCPLGCVILYFVGYLECLRQLTSVGNVTRESFEGRVLPYLYHRHHCSLHKSESRKTRLHEDEWRHLHAHCNK